MVTVIPSPARAQRPDAAGDRRPCPTAWALRCVEAPQRAVVISPLLNSAVVLHIAKLRYG